MNLGLNAHYNTYRYRWPPWFLNFFIVMIPIDCKITIFRYTCIVFMQSSPFSFSPQQIVNSTETHNHISHILLYKDLMSIMIHKVVDLSKT